MAEGGGHVAHAQVLAPYAVAVAVPVLGDRLVDDVPTGDAPAIAARHAQDVVAVGVGKGSSGAVDALEGRPAVLAVPDQGVAMQAQPVGGREGGHRVGAAER